MKKIISIIVMFVFSTLMFAQNNSSGKEKKANAKAESKVHYIDRRTEKNQDSKKLPRVVNQKKADMRKSPSVK
jgi:hypothetical protein